MWISFGQLWGGVMLILVSLNEDHPAGDRLYDPRNLRFDLLAYKGGSVLNYNHRAVWEVANPLALLLTLLDNFNLKFLAR